MNNYDARQLKNGKWHYTCMMSDGFIFPVGYCSSEQECPKCKGHSMFSCSEEWNCEHCQNKGVVKRKEICLGHDTEEEAREHYKQYMLDNVTYLESEDQQNRCKICGDWTSKMAVVGKGIPDYYSLCEAHSNRESLDKLVTVGTVWCS